MAALKETAKLEPAEKPAKTPVTIKEEKVDRQLEDSFPASDPPAFSGGNHFIGAPVDRETEIPTPDSLDVAAAERKVKDGTAVKPEKY